MTKQAYLQQIHSMKGSTTTTLAKIEYHVNNLPEIFCRKRRAILGHAIALHNCKQGHGWIDHNHIYKTSLLNISKISMDLSVDTWIHSNKITAVTDLVKLPSP